MLDPMLPDEVAVKTVPRQKFAGLMKIFVLNQFQGLFLVHKLHFLAQILNVLWSTLFLLDVFANGDTGQIIAAIVVYPIFVFYFACMIRVLSELAISVLLLPSLLARANSGRGAEGAQVVNGGMADADLAAYGVGVPNDAGTIV